MTLEFEVTAVISSSPEDIYNAWLDSRGHSNMTGSPAKVSDKTGEEFTAWDGYIQGTNLELDPGKRIVQSWRTLEFQDSEEDSRVEIRFEAVKGGTKIVLFHSILPLKYYNDLLPHTDIQPLAAF